MQIASLKSKLINSVVQNTYEIFMKLNSIYKKHIEPHSHPTFLSNFILGSQDGLVNVLGILLGLSAATTDIRLIIVGSLAALAAESISMGAVAYTSTLARHKHYLKEVEREKREMKETPEAERKEVEAVLSEWGYTGRKLERMAQGICSNPKAMLEFMMAFELKLSPVSKSEARYSFTTVLLSTMFGSILPIIPFLVSGNIIYDAVSSVVLSGFVLFIIGYYEAKVTVGSLWRSGLQMLVIGLTAGIVGYLIGHFLGAAPV